MPSANRETLVLTLPPDPALARLTRLATLHFLRQNGVRAMAARRGARAVERQAKALLRPSSRPNGRTQGAPLDLVLTAGASTLDVVMRRGARKKASRLARTDPRGPR